MNKICRQNIFGPTLIKRESVKQTPPPPTQCMEVCLVVTPFILNKSVELYPDILKLKLAHSLKCYDDFRSLFYGQTSLVLEREKNCHSAWCVKLRPQIQNFPLKCYLFNFCKASENFDCYPKMGKQFFFFKHF